MKKMLIAILAVTTIVLGYTAMAEAAETFSQSVPLLLSIPAEFGFELTKDSYDFREVPTGTGAQTSFGIFCKSNHNKVWTLSLNADEFSNGTVVIPEGEAFTCAAWGDASGEFVLEGTFATFPMNVPVTQTVFYTSSLNEGGKPFVPVTLEVYLSIPSAQESGNYTTNLVITMTD